MQQVDSRVAPDLKWPNDLLIDGKKFCGILTEMNAEATRVRYIVVGIGINVNQASFPEELQPIATSLRLASGTRVVARGTVRGFAKIARPRISRICWISRARDEIDSAAISGRIRRRCADGKCRIEENGGFEGVTEGLGSARVSAGAHAARFADGVERDGESEIVSAALKMLKLRGEIETLDSRRRTPTLLITSMLLVLDVGNTNTVLGVFARRQERDGAGTIRRTMSQLVANWRVATIATQTVDEYGVLFRNLFAMDKIEVKGIHGIVISSVVPPLDSTSAPGLRTLFQLPSRCSSSPASRPACRCFTTIPPKSARIAS